jgi:hypothetical protein
MKINTNSWHYRLIDKDWNARTTTNLCQYCQRLFFSTVVFRMLLLPLMFVAWLVLVVGLGSILLPFGIRPANPYGPDGQMLWTDYKRFDCGFLGRRYPIDFMLGLGAIALIVRGAITFPLVVACIMGVPSLLMALYFLIGWLRKQDSETLTLAKEWVSAKKAGVCPLITFVDPTKETIVND